MHDLRVVKEFEVYQEANGSQGRTGGPHKPTAGSSMKGTERTHIPVGHICLECYIELHC